MKENHKSQTTKRRGAPIGNEFWRMVKLPTGRPPRYTPATLWNKAIKYFEWVYLNPLKETKAFNNGRKASISRPRAMTEKAFCLFAGIHEDTFRKYKNGVPGKDYIGVTEAISNIIYLQKFEGAAADMFNANIISRELGLIERSKIDIDFDRMTEEQIDKIVNNILKKSDHE